MDEPTKERMRQAAVRERRWEDAVNELRQRNYASLLLDEFIQSCDQQKEYFRYFSDDLLPHYNTKQLDHLLATATRERRWDMAGKALQFGGSQAQRAQTIDMVEMALNYEQKTFCFTLWTAIIGSLVVVVFAWYLFFGIISKMREKTVNTPDFVCRPNRVCFRCISDSRCNEFNDDGIQVQKTIPVEPTKPERGVMLVLTVFLVTVCFYCTFEEFYNPPKPLTFEDLNSYILRHCNLEELNRVLLISIRKKMWPLASEVLKLRSETVCARTLEEAAIDGM
jgi:hypothetical protein